MKKIILFLALLSLGVSKAQVVGGYLPVNSTKSATMGGLRVNGTSTFTGNALFSSSVGIGALPTSSLSSFRLVKGTGSVDIGQPFSGYGGLWMGSSSPSTTNFLLASDGSNPSVNGTTSLAFQIANSTKLLANSGGVNVTGSLTASSTFSLGSANLTGGNTGTVAVLSDAVFCTQSSIKPYDPGDGLTIYFANSGYLGLTTSATYNRIYVPKNCTLIGYDITGYTDGTSGTAETSTISIRIDNTTDVTLNSSITYTTTYQQWHSMALSTDINSGSYFNLKWVTPTWVTNPTDVVNSVVLWFKLR